MTIEQQIKPQVGDVWESNSELERILCVGQQSVYIKHMPSGKESFCYLDVFLEDYELIERDGKSYEPTPQSLEDRIKAEYPEYEVKMLKWSEQGELECKLLHFNQPHIYAQSIKGFSGFVYDYSDTSVPLTADEIDFKMSLRPVVRNSQDETMHPVAALFTKDSKEEV